MMRLFFLFLIVTVYPGLSRAYSKENELGVIIERAAGKVILVDTDGRSKITEIEGLGDLSHASVVFSNDQRYAFVFGRDGGLSKLDLSNKKLSKRIIQAGNSIGGAISEDGKLVAVSNYEPGGVKIFDADTLKLLADIPAYYGNKRQRSKVVGLVEAPGQRFVFSLFDAGEIWLADMTNIRKPIVRKFKKVGRQPYDALITPDGQFYIAGLFGEDGLALLDLQNPDNGIKRILDGYGRGKKKLPVYKMPHLEGWAIAGDYAFLPAVGQHSVLVVNRHNWREVKRVPLSGQPVFAMARPDGQKVWINFAMPHNDIIQIIDTETLTIDKQIKPGKAVLHMEFTTSGNEVWVSVRDENLVKVYNTRDLNVLQEIEADKPSGIFFTNRAYKTGL